jgi:small subunit ribosomal protein S6
MKTTDVLSDAKKYELMVIINSDIGEMAVKNRLEAIRSQIIAFPGNIVHEEIWGLRDLAYPIKKHNQGCYALFDFETDPSKIKEIDAVLRLEPEVLRHLVMVLPATYQPKDYTIVEEELLEANKEAEAKKGLAPVRLVKMETKTPEAPKEKTIAPKSEPEAKAPSEEKPKSAKPNSENVDAKLQSILENPDLNF